MEIFTTKEAVGTTASRLRAEGYSIGLVPTMGALHEGHISLVQKAVNENDYVIVTVFVNPTQFNDPEDLRKYPRNLEKDLDILKNTGVKYVFTPEVEEMYPEQDERTFDLHPLDQVMEGEKRKGHFNGVAQIVSSFFEIIHPHRAYFGQKDFQQLVIIKHLVSIMNYNIEIIPCPIIREPDGLAMSSRNQLLSFEERKLAPYIFLIMKQASELRHTLSPAEIRDWVTKQFNHNKYFRFEYFEIVDDKQLKPVRNWSDPGNKVGCIAVYLGGIRLIDNIIFN